MPTYQYECSGCGYSFEELQLITAKKLRKCPECERNKLCRLIGSGIGIIFKGSGFYQTDYKNKTESDQKKQKQTAESNASKPQKTECQKEKKADK